MQTRGSVRAQRAAYDWLQALEGRRLILEKTRDGAEVVDFMVAVLRGARFRWPELHPKELPALPVRPTSQQRVAAALWLAERIWGLPTRGDPPETVTSVTADEAIEPTAAEAGLLEAMRTLALERAQAQADAGVDLDRSVIPGAPDGGPTLEP